MLKHFLNITYFISSVWLLLFLLIYDFYFLFFHRSSRFYRQSFKFVPFELSCVSIYYFFLLVFSSSYILSRSILSLSFHFVPLIYSQSQYFNFFLSYLSVYFSLFFLIYFQSIFLYSLLIYSQCLFSFSWIILSLCNCAY